MVEDHEQGGTVRGPQSSPARKGIVSHEALKMELKRISALATGDPILTKRLLDDAPEVLREHGIVLPPDKRVMAVLQDDLVELLLLPDISAEGELTIQALEQIAGGTTPLATFGQGNQTGKY